ncbi:PaaX family transcriptional regulator C-terminal domain-containing protein [Phaeobacter sp. QD34_3]|uniref:PaaX family transcriptional regulator C-terminal domain-containing protein n=1 Tax=unclassified Phaeobacter TaxID=2621772 RepID=UPI00237FA851|nr:MULTISPECIES: PaaX family transcriptional regulator C-terminal domain-containing protein [unclassified Phaeobacter]MDE4134067.1 PaaX family transcriptional regulator C-terminal domain-containing protein [Phaeobacter sp. QD34_3]MDE4137809.1 PaaX family transcriptional regulator C-terminal domain-containing protein [Phaeobacter sp. QD34_24]MDE4173232.1 PaaX family transcriptional regulator C-terminal domain-containing protein [Phaeobacter sp. PT47_59]
MSTEQNPWFDASVAQLNDPQNLRVWSIIVSLFGDLAQKEGDQISGGALTRIITPMGIKPEAIRVALHRLRKDGWIESTRSGRASVHYLTGFGRSQSAAVTPRIYERNPPAPTDWHLLISEEGAGQETLDDVLLLPNYVAVNRHTALGHGRIPCNLDDLLAIEVSDISVPGWLKDRLFPSDLQQACETLDTALKGISPPPADLDPAQIATLRTLIVHRWRRIVLRHPGLPTLFHPKTWRGPSCRRQVFDLLDALPAPGLSDLNAAP